MACRRSAVRSRLAPPFFRRCRAPTPVPVSIIDATIARRLRALAWRDSVTGCPRIPIPAEVGNGRGKKRGYIPSPPNERRIGMQTKFNMATVRTLGVGLVAAIGLAGCATYSDEFATINSRLDTLDTRVQGAAQSAESANQSAQQANRRLDQIESRVQQLEAAPRRVPRG